ncbi:hypothetical protein GCM10019017_60510 [Streptomyces showdoensis]
MATARAAGGAGVAHSHPARPGPASRRPGGPMIEPPASKIAERRGHAPANPPTGGPPGPPGPLGTKGSPFAPAGAGTPKAGREPRGLLRPGGGGPAAHPTPFDAPNGSRIPPGTTAAQGNGAVRQGSSGGPHPAPPSTRHAPADVATTGGTSRAAGPRGHRPPGSGGLGADAPPRPCGRLP